MVSFVLSYFNGPPFTSAYRSLLQRFSPPRLYSAMAGWISIKKALVFATSVIALANGAACPYSGVGDGLKPRSLLDPEHRLEPRFHTGSDFGRCLSKRLSKFAGGGSRSWDWWPCELSLNVLRQNGKESNPLGADVIYANEFAKLDCKSSRMGKATANAKKNS